jgi:hypothetical protein
MNTTTSADLGLVTSGSNVDVECSPVMEIDNGTTDRMFASVFADGNLTGACSRTCLGGCLYSFNVINPFPANLNASRATISMFSLLKLTPKFSS